MLNAYLSSEPNTLLFKCDLLIVECRVFQREGTNVLLKKQTITLFAFKPF